MDNKDGESIDVNILLFNIPVLWQDSGHLNLFFCPLVALRIISITQLVD